MGNIVSISTTSEKRQCPICEAGVVRASLEEQSFAYGEGDDAVTLKAVVPVWSCDSCGDDFTDGEAERIRHEVVCTHLGRLTPAALRQIRERYGYSQEGWADLTGIGTASIKRWETGTQIQNASLDLLLRLLRRSDIHDLAVAESGRRPLFSDPTFKIPPTDESRREAETFQLRPRRMM